MLRKSVGWDGATPDIWEQCLRQAGGIVVGVRDSAGALVGMGRVTPDPRHAVFCDLAVNPNHQGQGIGTAIIQKRIEWADQKHITYLYTDLSDSNPLLDVYMSVGFIKKERSLFRSRS